MGGRTVHSAAISLRRLANVRAIGRFGSEAINPQPAAFRIACSATEAFTDATAAVARLDEVYLRNTRFLRDRFATYVSGEPLGTRVRATYPFVRVTTSSHARLTRTSPMASSRGRACTKPP